MAKVSIIIPSRNETYEITPGVTVLQQTIRDIYEKATGDFEVLLAFDGPPYQKIDNHPNLTILELPETIGLKRCINKLAEMATGKYLCKTDSHCMFNTGFDEILQADMEDTWVVTPRFYVLDAENWKLQDADKFYDYFYLCCPFTDARGFRFKAGGHWREKTREKLDILIDETPQFHGSCWFINREHFLKNIGGFPTIDPFGHAQEPPYLGLKTWLGPWGGKVMVNKKTWYAHMHKGGQRGRGYPMSKTQDHYSSSLSANFWMGNEWPERIHDIDWFIKKFMPMPTWPDNWEKLYHTWLQSK